MANEMVVREKNELVAGNEMVASNGAIVEINNVLDLQKILFACNKLKEQQQMDLLVNQIKEMEKNYSAVIQELNAIKEQLREMEARDKAPGGVLSKLAQEADSKVTEQFNKFQNLKKDLNEKAGKLIQKFKEMGITALNNVCQFLGIKEKLITLRDATRSNEMKDIQATEKIENIQIELGLAKMHMKNIGRVATGKETLYPSELPESKQGVVNKFLEKLKSLYSKEAKLFSSIVTKLDKAIDKFDALEAKASVLGKLSDNKKEISAKDTVDKAEAIRNEQKRDDMTR